MTLCRVKKRPQRDKKGERMKKEFTGIFRGNEKGFGFVKIEVSLEETSPKRQKGKKWKV